MIRVRSRLVALALAGALAFGLASASVVASGTSASAASPKCVQSVDVYYKDSKWHWGAVPGIDNARIKTTNCVLKYGMWNNAGVKALQHSLNVCYGRNLALDGDFGAGTRAALRYAQSREGIAVDGVYGKQSRDNLKWYIASKRSCYNYGRLVW